MLMQPVVPEYMAVRDSLNDITVRAQQCLIALDVYQKQLQQVEQLIPGLRSVAVDTDEWSMDWAAPKSPRELIEYQNRSKQFILLSGWNFAVSLLDTFMKVIAIRYWKLNVPHMADGKVDETWFSPDGFEMVTDVKVSLFPQAEAVDDIRHTVDRVRLLKRTNAITVSDFFDGIQKIGEFIYGLACAAAIRAVGLGNQNEGRIGPDKKGKEPGSDSSDGEPEDSDT